MTEDMDRGLHTVPDGRVPIWMVSWTTDGGVWHDRGFHTFEEAQGFARRLYAEHSQDTDFRFYASRMMTVNTQSFLSAGSGGAVKLAPHMLGTADTFA